MLFTLKWDSASRRPAASWSGRPSLCEAARAAPSRTCCGRTTSVCVRAKSIATATASKMADNVMIKITATAPRSSRTTSTSVSRARPPPTAKSRPQRRRTRPIIAQCPRESLAARRMPQQVLPPAQRGEVGLIQFADIDGPLPNHRRRRPQARAGVASIGLPLPAAALSDGWRGRLRLGALLVRERYTWRAGLTSQPLAPARRNRCLGMSIHGSTLLRVHFTSQL